MKKIIATSLIAISILTSAASADYPTIIKFENRAYVSTNYEDSSNLIKLFNKGDQTDRNFAATQSAKLCKNQKYIEYKIKKNCLVCTLTNLKGVTIKDKEDNFKECYTKYLEHNGKPLFK